MMRQNKKKSIPDQLSPGSTRTESNVGAPGHLSTNGLQGSVDPAEEPGQAIVELLEPNKRKIWTVAENQDIMKCYYQPNPSARGFQKRMMQIWIEKHPDSNISEQRIMDQRRFIIRNKIFTEMELYEFEEIARGKIHVFDQPKRKCIGVAETEIAEEDTTNDNEPYMVNQNTHNPETTEIQKDLREKIIHHMNQSMGRHRLPIIHQTQSKKVKDLLNTANLVVSTIQTNTLEEINQLMYSTAAVITVELGYKMKKRTIPGTPKWKIRLEKKIDKLRGDISNLKNLKEGKLKNQKVKDLLCRRYDIEGKTMVVIGEELRQRVTAIAKKIERYDSRIKQYRENVQYRTNQHWFYKSLDENKAKGKISPNKEDTLKFWKDIWENPVEHNHNASWIKEVRKELKGNVMDNIIITTEMVEKQVKNVKNWSAPGPDELHGFWLKHLTSLHQCIAIQFNNMLQNHTSGEWLTTGRTFLIMKDSEKGNEPNNYRPITCLPTTFKLLTRILANSIYSYLTEKNLYPVEQKGNFKKSRGTKDQLLIDKMILKNSKRRKTNLSVAWIDYKKAFDSLPHSWIVTCLEMFGVGENVCKFIQENMKRWKTTLVTNGETFGDVFIKRGIFQGDSLSPLLFNIALIPLTSILKKTNTGYNISTQHGKINHLLYMDNLKLYAKKNRIELESLVNTVHQFSSDIQMMFGLDKCAILSVQRGKIQEIEGIELDNGKIMTSLAKNESYKYLGILESNNMLHTKVKDATQKEYIRRARKILKSKLNGGNTIKAINTWAIPVIRYSAGIIDWTQADLDKLDRKTRKLLNIHHSLHPKSDIDRLYLPRNIGGRGLLQVYQTVEEEKRSLCEYISRSKERLLQAVKSENILKTTQSKAEYKKVQFETRLNGWRNKPLHGQHLKNIEGKHDNNLTWAWLKSGIIKKETEGLIFAAQEQALQTNAMKAKIQKISDNAKCRLCQQKDETVSHLICECSKIAQTDYKSRHDRLAKLIHWALCKKYNLPASENSWEHQVEKVVENEKVKILWDFRIQTDRHLDHNTPDITVIENRKVWFVDVAIPGDQRIEDKEQEKMIKYCDLAIEATRLWMKHVTIVPIIIGALGTISKNFMNYINKLQVQITPLELQKTALLGTTYILRRYLVDT